MKDEFEPTFLLFVLYFNYKHLIEFRVDNLKSESVNFNAKVGLEQGFLKF